MEVQRAAGRGGTAGHAVRFGRFLAVRAALALGGAAVGALAALVLAPGDAWSEAAAGAGAGAFVALLLALVPWRGWEIVPPAAGVGALVPLLPLLGGLWGDPDGAFGRFYRRTKTRLGAVARRTG